MFLNMSWRGKKCNYPCSIYYSSRSWECADQESSFL